MTAELFVHALLPTGLCPLEQHVEGGLVVVDPMAEVKACLAGGLANGGPLGVALLDRGGMVDAVVGVGWSLANRSGVAGTLGHVPRSTVEVWTVIRVHLVLALSSRMDKSSPPPPSAVGSQISPQFHEYLGLRCRCTVNRYR